MREEAAPADPVVATAEVAAAPAVLVEPMVESMAVPTAVHLATG